MTKQDGAPGEPTTTLLDPSAVGTAPAAEPDEPPASEPTGEPGAVDKSSATPPASAAVPSAATSSSTDDELAKAAHLFEQMTREAGERLVSLAARAKDRGPDARAMHELGLVTSLLAKLVEKYPSPKSAEVAVFTTVDEVEKRLSERFAAAIERVSKDLADGQAALVKQIAALREERGKGSAVEAAPPPSAAPAPASDELTTLRKSVARSLEGFGLQIGQLIGQQTALHRELDRVLGTPEASAARAEPAAPKRTTWPADLAADLDTTSPQS